MRLTSTITSYDPRWPTTFAEAADALRPIFGDDLRGIHHIGSTAVPGLGAKPEIDILAMMDEPGLPDRWTAELAKRGYRRGGDLSDGHHFFKRDVDGIRTHKLHICRSGHPMALQMLLFRDHLRIHAEDRADYDRLKRRLEAENVTGIQEYLARKAPYIRALLDRIDRA